MENNPSKASRKETILSLSYGIFSALLSVFFFYLFLRIFSLYKEELSLTSSLSSSILLSYESLFLAVFFLVTGILLVVFRKKKSFPSLFSSFVLFLLSFLLVLALIFAFLLFTGEEKRGGYLQFGVSILLASSLFLFALGEKEKEKRRLYRIVSYSFLCLSFLLGCFLPLVLSTFGKETENCILFFFLLLLIYSLVLLFSFFLVKDGEEEEAG
ncbi:MAG: hypothetical protein WCS91_03265 [Bacilli bacterium]